jgi:hypothetical protein
VIDPASLSTPLAFALAYASMGWHVLPLEAGGKQPQGKLVPRGMLDASVDTEIIRRWWKAYPDAGIGIALAQSGLVAIDIDPRNGGNETFDALQAEHGSLRSEVMAFTGGGGEHHVFLVPNGAQIRLPGTLGPGIDLKANGYIVVEPSIHPNGKQYGWEHSSNPLDGVVPSPLPDWLRSLRIDLKQPKIAPGNVPVDPLQAQHAREALYLLDADSYDDWIKAGMAFHSTGWGQFAFAMWCAWSQLSDKFDSTVSRKKWESFRDDREQGLTIAWVFAKAQALGWVNPSRHVVQAGEIVPLTYGAADGQEPDDGLPRILTLAELRETSKNVSWLVKHVIPADSVGVVFGGSGTFKSFVVLDMVLHVAHGMRWLGKKTKQGTVLFIAAEGGAGLWRRIVAWHRANKQQWEQAQVYVLPMAVDLMEDASAVQAAASKVGFRPDVVVIDTMSQTFNGDENSAPEVAKYLRELGLWFRSAWQASVIVVHHTGHKETERARGSSAIRSNVDFMFSVCRDEKEMLATFECVKQKDGEAGGPQSFSLQVIDLAVDEDGDPITSLVASALDGQGQVLHAMAHEAERGRGGHRQLFLELALNGMEEKKVRTAFYEAIEGDAEAKRKAYYRSRSWAVSSKVLELVQGFIVRTGE